MAGYIPKRDELTEQEYDLSDKEAALRAKLDDLNKQEQALVRRREGISDADAERIDAQREALGNQLNSVSQQRTTLAKSLDAKYAATKPRSYFEERELDDDDDTPDAEIDYGNRGNATKAGSDANIQRQTAETIRKSETVTTVSAVTNTENTVTTGGGATTRKYPDGALDEYNNKRVAAEAADRAAQKQVNDEYLRSQGLENASSGEKLRALSAAKREGKVPTVTTAQDEFAATVKKPEMITVREEGENKAEEKVTNNVTASTQTAAGSVQPNNPDAGVSAKDPDEDEDDKDLDDEEVSNLEKEGNDDNSGALIKDDEKDLIDANEDGVMLDEEGNVIDNNASGPLSTEPVPSKDTVTNVGAEEADNSKVKVTGTPDLPVPTPDAKGVQQFPKTTTPSVVVQSEVVEQDYTGNILHNYPSYTYRISMFMVSATEYKTIVETPELWRPKNCIISGAGKHNTTDAIRHPEFKDDFYFDELSIMTMVGLNAKSKASNALELSFTIIEPYGITFLDRLVAASEYVGSKNYLDMPYVMQIEFFGIKEDGTVDTQSIPKTRKRFPIRILSLDLEATAAGARYKVMASPYSQGAYDEKLAVAGVNLTVTAKTVGDFFRTKDSDLVAKIKTQREGAQQQTNIKNQLRGATSPAQIEALNNKLNAVKDATPTGPLTTETYPAGVNAWFNYMVAEDARTFADKIIFDIDPEIAKSEITDPQTTDHKNTPFVQPGTSAGAAVARNGGEGPKFEQKGYVINAGTSVLKVIDMVMRNSKYITDQIVDPAVSKEAAKMSPEELAKKLNKEFNWYKVTATVELGEFDEKANRYAKIVTYHIRKYPIADAKTANTPRKKPTRYHKSYDYLYTGANNDILDFRIQFNALYYSVLSVNRANAQKTRVKPGKTEAETAKQSNVTGGKNVAIPEQREAQAAGGANSGGADAQASTVNIVAQDIQRNIYQNAKADMLTLTLTIVGDPDFIKQDEVYIGAKNKNYDKETSQSKLTDGSIVYDRQEVYARVAFKTPTDIDEKTGLIRGDGKYVDTSFTGLYRVMTVVNKFRQGKFTQEVDLIRILDHDVNLAKSNVVPTERQVVESLKRGKPIETQRPATSRLGEQGNVTSGSTPTYDDFGNITGYEETGGYDEVGLNLPAVNGVPGAVPTAGIPSLPSTAQKALQAMGGAMSVVNGVKQLTSSFNGGLGGLQGGLDAVAQIGGGLGGIAQAMPGSINELTGAVGAGFPGIDAFGGTGDDIIQGVTTAASKFANGVGVTGANPDLTEIAYNDDEIDIAGLQAEEMSPTPEKPPTPIILGGFQATTSSLLTAAQKAKQVVAEQAALAGIEMPSVDTIADMPAVLNAQMSAAGIDPTNLDGLAKNGVNLSQLQANATTSGSLTGKLNGMVNKLNDPNAPPYTGNDPIIRARLGLPPIDEDGIVT